MTSPRFSTASCVVTLRDVNDNAPQLASRREISIKESTPVGSIVTRFNADDSDDGDNGRVTYAIVSERSQAGNSDFSKFVLDPTTGWCTFSCLFA